MFLAVFFLQLILILILCSNRLLIINYLSSIMTAIVAGIEGLCTVLSCVVDYKGDRIVGQTIIPGVLQTVNVGRLILSNELILF